MKKSDAINEPSTVDLLHDYANLLATDSPGLPNFDLYKDHSSPPSNKSEEHHKALLTYRRKLAYMEYLHKIQ